MMSPGTKRAVTMIVGMVAAVPCLLLAVDVGCMNGHLFFAGPREPTAMLARVKQVVAALHIYATDNDGFLPHRFSTSDELRASLSDFPDEMFASVNPNGGKIVPNRLLAGLNLSEIPLPEKTVLVYESRVFPDGRLTVGFVDSHARRVQDLGELRFGVENPR